MRLKATQRWKIMGTLVANAQEWSTGMTHTALLARVRSETGFDLTRDQLRGMLNNLRELGTDYVITTTRVNVSRAEQYEERFAALEEQVKALGAMARRVAVLERQFAELQVTLEQLLQVTATAASLEEISTLVGEHHARLVKLETPGGSQAKLRLADVDDGAPF